LLRLIAVLLLAIGLALGVLVGWEAPLGAALFRYDAGLLNTAQAVIQRYMSPALWGDAVVRCWSARPGCCPRRSGPCC
jgi:hypothetical protein